MDINDLEKIELQREEKLEPQSLKLGDIKKEKLKIVYLMVWTKTCGGSKIILEYVNRLRDLGHEITIITYDQKPTWFPLSEDIMFIQLNPDEKMENVIPNCDIVVATSWKNIYSALKANKAPVVYFEQGGGHIFDIDNQPELKRNVVKERICAVPFIYTVSNYAKDVIKKNYQKDAYVVYNAVDNSIFYPRKEKKRNNDVITITTIGPEEFEFKHVDNIIQAVNILKNSYKINFNWISQTKPCKHDEKAVVNPPQMQIGEILRDTDIYICASDYESFGLPVLEAMTCGSSVVTTNNGGVSDFLQDGVTGLFIEKNDVNDIIKKVRMLIENEEYREKLAKSGMEKAKEFNWESSVKKLENYYKDIARYQVTSK